MRYSKLWKKILVTVLFFVGLLIAMIYSDVVDKGVEFIDSLINNLVFSTVVFGIAGIFVSCIYVYTVLMFIDTLE